MKTVVITNNQEADSDHTSWVLTPFQDGMREAGAEIRILHTDRLNINPCSKCKKCLYKTPGECYQRDDMKSVLSELRQAEVWVFAVPHKSKGLSAPIKDLVDRLLPLTYRTNQNRRNSNRGSNKLMRRLFSAAKSMNENPGEGRQSGSSTGTKNGKLVLVSGCDNRELDNFAPLVSKIQSIAKTHNKVFAGALLCPQAGVIGPVLKEGGELGGIAGAAYEAGQQLVRGGTIQPETLAIVRREISSQESVVTAKERDIQRISAQA